MKPEQQTVPLVYRFTIAQAFSVVKPFELLFFRKNAIFLDFFRPLSLHTLGIYPSEIYLSCFFCKISNVLASRENYFIQSLSHLSHLLHFSVFRLHLKKETAQNSPLPLSFHLRVFYVFFPFFIYYFVDLIISFKSQLFLLFPFPFCLSTTIIRLIEKIITI